MSLEFIIPKSETLSSTAPSTASSQNNYSSMGKRYRLDVYVQGEILRISCVGSDTIAQIEGMVRTRYFKAHRSALRVKELRVAEKLSLLAAEDRLCEILDASYEAIRVVLEGEDISSEIADKFTKKHTCPQIGEKCSLCGTIYSGAHATSLENLQLSPRKPKPLSRNNQPLISSFDIQQANEAVESLCSLFPEANRSEVEEAILLCNGDPVKAHDMVFRNVNERKNNQNASEKAALQFLDEERARLAREAKAEEESLRIAQELQKAEQAIYTTFECVGCFDEVTNEHAFIFGTCNHKSCRECAMLAFKAQISENDVHPGLKCPYCKIIVEDDRLEFILDRDTWDKFQDMRFKLALAKAGDFKCCLHPGCEDGVFWADEPDSSGKFHCNSCRHKFCLRCADKWHDGETCERFQQWKKENGQGETLLQQMIAKGTIRLCPGCKTPSQKVSGCNYVQCKVCKMAWCWHCNDKHKDCHCGKNPHK